MQTPPRPRRSAAARGHLTLLHAAPAPMIEGARAPLRRIDAPLAVGGSTAQIAPPVSYRAPEMVDLPLPGWPVTELESAIETLRYAAQSDSVTAKGDAILSAMGHLTAALGELFDRETAQRFLAQLSRTV